MNTIKFFDKLEYNYFKYRNHIALIDSANDEELSYENLNIESGKVYGYLKKALHQNVWWKSKSFPS